MTHRTFWVFAFCLVFISDARFTDAADRPNIVWISFEDITPILGCYGDEYARTPVLDRFAATGIRYTKAHTVAPVCSTSRFSVINGHVPCVSRHASSPKPDSRAEVPEDVAESAS